MEEIKFDFVLADVLALPLYRNKVWLHYEIDVEKKTQKRVAKDFGINKSSISYWYSEERRIHRKQYNNTYREENKEKCSEYGKQYRRNNMQRIKKYNKEYQKDYRIKNRDKINRQVREIVKNIKIQAFEILGGCKCQLCEVTDVDELTIDHIDSTGYLDKKEGYSDQTLYYAIVKGTYPKERLSNLRVLCYNHNDARIREYLDLPYELQTKYQRSQTKLWKEAFDFFGGCPCGITELKFLTVSHIHNDGAERRRNGEPGGYGLLKRFRRLGWTESLKNDYRLECANCNCKKKTF